ncbi:MAG: hypothetical protein ACLS9K_15405 [Lachnospira eligens]
MTLQRAFCKYEEKLHGILLLFLGMGVSSVVGIFENVVSQLAIIVCFQSLILDMAGNVGTVTCRYNQSSYRRIYQLSKLEFVLKEMKLVL